MNIYDQHKEYWLTLIIDRLTGSTSDESDLQLQQWIEASEENKLYFESLQKLWESLDLSNEAEQYDSNKAFELFKDRARTDTLETARKKKAEKHLPLRKWLSYAAVFIPFLLLCYCTSRYFILQFEDWKAPRLSEVVVPNGSKIQLTLQDGSKVWLNAGSRLQYDSNFGKKSRIIKLSGEAYLEVARNEASPFIVDAGAVKVKVLGTRFNINAYSDNNEIKVALLQGSIEMKTSGGTTLQLAPQDVARFNISSGQTQLCHSSDCSQNPIDWVDSRLVFDGEDFEQIAHTLERNFNVKINIHRDTIKKRRFIGDFVNNETIEQIFNVMSSDGKFRYAIKGNMIDIY